MLKQSLVAVLELLIVRVKNECSVSSLRYILWFTVSICSTVPALHICSCTEVRSRKYINKTLNPVILTDNWSFYYFYFSLTLTLKPQGVRETGRKSDRMKSNNRINVGDTKEKRGRKRHQSIRVEERRVMQNVKRFQASTRTWSKQILNISAIKDKTEATPVSNTQDSHAKAETT